MTFLSIFAFGKEFFLINDSLIIMTVMALLLTLIIRNFSNMLKESFEVSRQNTQKDLNYIIKNVLKHSFAYRSKLEDIIELNLKRNLLLPSFNKKEEDNFNPENKIKEISFQY